MSKAKKIWILILTAVFFFTLGFFLVFQSADLPLLEEQPSKVDLPAPLDDEVAYEDDDTNENIANQLTTNTKDEPTVDSQPTVEITSLPPLSTGEMIEQSVRESMQRELNFTWEEHQRYMGILGDHVAVFRGEPGVGGILIEETDISIEKLPDFELRNLRQGIAFSTEEEKYSILEGLHFPK